MLQALLCYQNKIIPIAGSFIAFGLLAEAVGHVQVKEALLLLATFVSGSSIFIKAYKKLPLAVFSIEMLLTLSVAGALYLQEYMEAAAVTFLFLLGAYLENCALAKVRAKLNNLSEIIPDMLPGKTQHKLVVGGQLVELMEEAVEATTKAEQSLENFAAVYTPMVLLLSAFVFIATQYLHKAVAILAVACPGALLIGAPASIAAGIGNGANNGLFFKCGAAMEKLSKVNALVIDRLSFEQMANGGETKNIATALKRVGINKVHVALSADEKVERVKQWQAEGRFVAVAGSGIEDAAAMVTANVGIAIGSQSIDALPIADVILIDSTLQRLSSACRLAQDTISNRRQNICLAVAGAFFLLGSILFDFTQLAGGMLIHEVGILLVTLNAVRLACRKYLFQ